MAYTPYYATWHDADSATGGGNTSTPLVAAALQHIEDGIAALSADFPSAAAIAASAHDVPVWNGSAWVRASGTPTAATVLKGDGSWADPAPAVTALPGSPVDGQEVVYTDSLTAPTYAWRLKYFSGASSPKWVFMGGTPMVSAVSGSLTTSTSGSFIDLTSGPTLTVPLTGTYYVIVGIRGDNASYSSQYGMLVRVFGSTLGAGNTRTFFVATLQFAMVRTQLPPESYSLTVAETLKIQCQIGAAQSTTFSEGQIQILPRRVS